MVWKILVADSFSDAGTLSRWSVRMYSSEPVCRCEFYAPGWFFSAALRYADLTSLAVAVFSTPRVSYGLMIGASSSSNNSSLGGAMVISY